MSLLTGAIRPVVSGFTNHADSKEARESTSEFLVMLIAFFVSLVVLSLIGQLLWNNVVVDLFTIAKPAKSVFQILGLFIFVALIRP
jgi:hypothetical protein